MRGGCVPALPGVFCAGEMLDWEAHGRLSCSRPVCPLVFMWPKGCQNFRRATDSLGCACLCGRGYCIEFIAIPVLDGGCSCLPQRMEQAGIGSAAARILRVCLA